MFMADADVDELSHIVAERGGLIVTNPEDGEQARQLPHLPHDHTPAWIARSEDISQIRIRVNPYSGSAYLDDLNSPVVEFSRGSEWRNDPRRPEGRMYFMTGTYDEAGRPVDYPAEFVTWADGLLRYVRRHWERDASLAVHLGPAFARRTAPGGRS